MEMFFFPYVLYTLFCMCIYVYLLVFLFPARTVWPLATFVFYLGCWGCWRCEGALSPWEGEGSEAPTSLMRAMKRFPKRQGLCRLHCNELTVICWDCCTATATMCTASYMSAASVCRPVSREKRRSRVNVDSRTWHITVHWQDGSAHCPRCRDEGLQGCSQNQRPPVIKIQPCAAADLHLFLIFTQLLWISNDCFINILCTDKRLLTVAIVITFCSGRGRGEGRKKIIWELRGQIWNVQ